MAVVLLTDDLMVASRVDGAARRVGVELVNCADAESIVARCAEHSIDRLIIDLSSRGGVARIVDRFETAGVTRPPMTAFGPHVHKERLTAAAEAGCEQVISRGQFFTELDAIFARLADRAEKPAQRHQDGSSDA